MIQPSQILLQVNHPSRDNLQAFPITDQTRCSMSPPVLNNRAALLQRAVAEKHETGAAYRAVAEKYKLPYADVYLWATISVGKQGRKAVLTSLEEQNIVQALLNVVDSGVPTKNDQLRDLIAEFVQKKGNVMSPAPYLQIVPRTMLGLEFFENPTLRNYDLHIPYVKRKNYSMQIILRQLLHNSPA